MDNHNVNCYCGITFLQNLGIDSIEIIRFHFNSKEHKESLIKNPVKELSYKCKNGHITRVNQRKGDKFNEPEQCWICKSPDLKFLPNIWRFLT